jgi:hypothetical protein
MNTIKESIRRWLLDDDRKVNEVRTTIGLQEPDRPSTTPVRTFSVSEALNGTYITFTRRKYNPNGPDDYLHEIYIVQPDESLIDAISTVLVLTEK